MNIPEWEKRFNEFWEEQANYSEVRVVSLTKDQIKLFFSEELVQARRSAYELGKKDTLREIVRVVKEAKEMIKKTVFEIKGGMPPAEILMEANGTIELIKDTERDVYDWLLTKLI